MVKFPPVNAIEDEAWKSDYVPSKAAAAQLQELYEECIKSRETEPSDVLEERILRLASALAPCKRLPPEVLSIIFRLSQEGLFYMIPIPVPEETEPRIPNTDGFPVGPRRSAFPERVCSVWRRVALSIPQLFWTTVVDYTRLWDTYTFNRDWERLTEFASEVIARGSREVCIKFSSADEAQSVTILQQLLGPQLERLQVSHDSPTPNILEAITDWLPKMPSLREFSLRIASDHDLEEDYWSGRAVLPFETTTSLPWVNLTVLHLIFDGGIIGISPAMAHLLLSISPSLESCKLPISMTPTSDIPPSRSCISLLKLRCLHLALLDEEGPWDEAFPALLKPLRLPLLEQLSINAPEITIETEPISDMLERSGCALSCFDLYGPCYLEDALNDLLESIPSVERFSLWKEPVTPEILEQIATGSFLPRVTVLSLFLNADEDDFEAAFEAARARKGPQKNNISELSAVTFIWMHNRHSWLDETITSVPDDLAAIYKAAGGYCKTQEIFPNPWF